MKRRSTDKVRTKWRDRRRRWFSWFLILWLTVLLVINWGQVQAAEEPQPPEDWQLQGIFAALDDSDPNVWAEALNKMSEYDLKSPVKIPSERIEKIGKLLKHENSSVRFAAANAVGNLGADAKPFFPQLQKLLEDEDWRVRSAAANAVGNLGAEAKPFFPQLLKLLEDEDSFVRSAAASAVGNLGAEAKPFFPQLQKLLEDDDSSVRYAAANGVGNLGAEAKPFFPQLQKLLEHENWDVRSAAANAVGNLGADAKPFFPQLQKLLEDEDSGVRSAAAKAVGNLGAKAKAFFPQLLKLLEDENLIFPSPAAEAVGNIGAEAKPFFPQLQKLLEDQDWRVRSAAANAVGNIGAEAKPFFPQLQKLLEDQDWRVRSAAANAVGNIGAEAKPFFPQLQKLLEDQDSGVRSAAASAVGNIGAEAKPFFPQLQKLLQDENSSVRDAAAYALEKMGQLEIEQILPILNAAHRDRDEEAARRFLAYYVSGGKPDAVTLTRWLGSPQQYPYETDKFGNQRSISREEGKKVLRLFAEIWKPSQSLLDLRQELERQIAIIVSEVDWQTEDSGLLQTHYQNLNALGSTHTDAIETKILELRGWRSLLWLRNILLTHALLWLILLGFYPKSPEVQTLFWRPLIRKIGGFGYIGLLLSWVPILRNKLFSPFQLCLIADASLDSFEAEDYFPNSEVCLKNTNKLEPLTIAIAKLKSPVILEGESGLGKSMFLRHWAKSCKGLVVYLPASQCSQGVIPAIQAKLPISQTDPQFLENLIKNHALEICIDGLNEVTPDTRVKIGYFVERHFKGHILLTTQPLDWTPPSTTKTYRLQPLKRPQIGEFLLTRQLSRSEDLSISRSEYHEACEEYLETAFNSQKQSEEERKAVRRLLSNPMDLTIVSQILAQGKTPDLLNLQQQQYTVMATDYQQMNLRSFPLATFSETAYQMRLNDEINIPADSWKKELHCMERYKMVLRRQRYVEGDSGSQWHFRHDKIQEYFIVQTFLGQNNEKVEQHINDPRFRGVYLLLAMFLPFEEAWLLRERLLQNAAETKDHVVSDQFIQRFNSRSKLSLNNYNFIEDLLEIIKLNAEKSNNISSHIEVKPDIRSEFMPDSNSSKYNLSGANLRNIIDQEQNGTVGHVVENAESGSHVVGTENNYISEQKQTLAEAAAEIQTLLKQLEENNPTATDAEKSAFVTASIPPSNRQRFVGALQSGGKEALKELLENPYVNIGVAIVEGWQNPA